MSLRLRIEHGQDAGTTWRLPTSGVYTLGRTPDNSIRVLDMKVSKHHCEIRLSSAKGRDRAVLHDLGSTHGCTLNGQPVTKGKAVALKAGDELRLGLTITRVLSAGDADADAQPVAGRAVDEAAVAKANGGHAKTKQTLPPDQLVGKKLGGYEIEKKIGAGGMGGVYLAEQVSLNRKVALKVLNETFASDSAFVDQFVNEARAAGALNHPNVVQVYDVGNDQGHYFFSMEVMPGGSIEDKVREGPVPWETGLNWFLDSANALIFAKRREILHRDVKPDNLMISEDGSAKLCDLGLAKKSEVGDLMDQGIIGTPHFISPEAIRRTNDIDHRTDLYSLGCSFYRIFTGKNPYAAGTVKDILLGHLNKPVPHVNDTHRDVPKEIDELVYGLMRKSVDERIQSPEDLLRELDKIRTKYNLEAHGIKPASKRPLLIGLTAALIAIGGAIAVVMNQEPAPSGPGEMSQEDRDRIVETARNTLGNDLRDYVQDATGKLLALDGRLVQGDLSPDNYTLRTWPKLSKEYTDAAATWQTKLDAWVQAAAAETDAVKRGHYTTSGAELTSLAGKARATAKEKIDAVVDRLTKRAALRKSERAKAVADVETRIRGFAETLKKRLDDREYIELEASLLKDAEGKNRIDRIVDELLTRVFDEYPLLNLAKDITPVLQKHLPAGPKTARGANALTEALRRLNAAHGTVMEGVTKQLQPPGGKTPGHKNFAEAARLLKTYLDGFPENLADPKVLTSAPRVVALMRSLRNKADVVYRQVLDKDAKLLAAELRADRAFYFAFVRKMWRPQDGLLQTFQFAEAEKQIALYQDLLKIPAYRELVAGWAPMVAGLKALFDKTIASYPDGWTDDDYTFLDSRGREKKGRIKAIGASGVKWDKNVDPFTSTGARTLLDKLFFFEGKPRLKECSADVRLGLAVLAELAGDYDAAQSQYKAAQSSYGDDPMAAWIMGRMQKLGYESQAAAKLLAIAAFSERADAWAALWKPKADALAEDPDAFSKEEREKVIVEGSQLLRDMPGIQQMKEELNDLPELAGTNWGTSLRDSVHAKVAYAGEELAPPRRVGPPKKAPRKGK